MEFISLLAPVLISQTFRRLVDSLDRWHTPCRCSYLGVVVWGASKETVNVLHVFGLSISRCCIN
jgi:hypothetical protein